MVPKGHGLKFRPTDRIVAMSYVGHIQGDQKDDICVHSNDSLKKSPRFLHHPRLQALPKIQK